MYRWLWGIVILVLQGCQIYSDTPYTLVDQKNITRVTKRKSKAVNQHIRFLVLHYTAENFEDSLALLTGANVSAHYLIPAKSIIDTISGKPVIFKLVPDKSIAWHAGVSFWRGWNNLNDTSIGIEQENLGFSKIGSVVQWYPYSSEQISLVIALVQQIVQRYQIAPVNVVGHSDIAPLRKKDPGPLFPWAALADAGIGAWPDQGTVTAFLAERDKKQVVAMAPLLSKLARYGYKIAPQMTLEEKRRVVAAFQMHFRPADISGEPDAETEAIIDALLVKYFN